MAESTPEENVMHSDTETFACCALQAVALSHLFNDEKQRKFCKEYLENILEYFQQPEQVKRTCHLILEDEEQQQMEPYAETLRSGTENTWMSVNDLLRNCLLAVMRRGQYDARARTLLKHICVPLRVSWDTFEDLEEKVVGLLESKDKSTEAESEGAKRASSRKKKRYALIGLAAIGGGALIGLTGGLAAPLVAAGAGVLVGGSAAVIGTTAGAAVLGSAFGLAGAGLTGYKMKKRVGALSEFEFVPMSTTQHLSITIAISGWIRTDINDFYLPWKTLDISKEQYYLKWESQYLKEMGQAMEYILSFVKGMAIQETLKLTVLSGLLTAIAWPAALISAASVIDNPWSVCLNRANEAGRVLANLLVSREQGARPVTLIGFSVGARVIFACLQELAKRKNDTEGIIEDVYLLGAPVSSNVRDWQPFTRIVAGKIVNCYSRTDWLLKFLFRTATVSKNIAGLEPVELQDRRMCNVDLTSFVNGHKEYFRQMDEILRLIGVRTRMPVTRTTSLMLGRSEGEKKTSSSLSASATFCRGSDRDGSRSESPAVGTIPEVVDNSEKEKRSIVEEEKMKEAEKTEEEEESSGVEVTGDTFPPSSEASVDKTPTDDVMVSEISADGDEKEEVQMDEIPPDTAVLPCPPESQETLEAWRASRRWSRVEPKMTRSPGYRHRRTRSQ